MAIVVKDRVKVTTSTTGTGTLTLGSAETDFQSFSVIGDGNQTYYAIKSDAGWEVGIGTYTLSSSTLSRDTILESSNSGSAVSLTGTSTVFTTYPAERASFSDQGLSKTYVADGAITAGKPTILTSAGKAQQFTLTGNSVTSGLGTDVQPNGSDYLNNSSITKVSDTQFVAYFTDSGNSNRPTAIVGTIGANKTITYGSKQTITNDTNVTKCEVIWDSNASKLHYYNYVSTDAYLYGATSNVNLATNTISGIGTWGVVMSNQIYDMIGLYDPDNNQVVLTANRTGDQLEIMSMSASTSPPTVSFDTTVSSITHGGGERAIGYDTNVDVFVCTGNDDDKFVAFTNSGSAFTASSVQDLALGNQDYMGFSFDPDANKFVYHYHPNGNTTQKIVALTVDSSRNITIGTPVDLGTADGTGSATSSYDPIAKKHIIFVGDAANKGNYYPVTMDSSGAMTVGSATEFAKTNYSVQRIVSTPCFTAMDENPIVIFYGDNNTSQGESAVFAFEQTPVSNLDNNYLGVASTSASDTEEVKINLPEGSINNSQSGLTVGDDYFCNTSGEIKKFITSSTTTDTTPSGAFATMDGSDTATEEPSSAYESTSGTFVIAYRDGSNGSKGTAVAGTWSNGVLTWGTPVVFESTAIDDQPKICAGGGRVHITYRDSSGNGGIKSGSISGTTLTFGSETVFASSGDSAYANPMGYHVAYDTSTNYIIIFYQGGSASVNTYVQPVHFDTSSYAYTLGTTTTVYADSLTSRYADIVFDPDTNRTVILYTDGTNSNYKTANVIQSTGTSGSPTVSVGADSVIASVNSSNSCMTYDTQNNKVFAVYKDDTDSNAMKGSIGTVTGGGTNTIAFTTPAEVWNPSGNPNNVEIEFDSDNNEAFFFYRDEDSGDDFTYKIITIGASSFTVASGGVLSANDNRFDSGSASFGTGKGVLCATMDTGNSSVLSYGTVYYGVVTTYTQTDAQYIGEAISTTALKLKETPTDIIFGKASTTIAKGNPVLVEADGDFAKVATVSTSSTVSGTYSQGSITKIDDLVNDKWSMDVASDGTTYGYAFRETSGETNFILGTRSGETITWGTPITLASFNSLATIVKYNPDQDVFVVAYANQSTHKHLAIAVSYSGTTATAGSEIELLASAWTSGGVDQYYDLVYDSNSKNTVFVCHGANNQLGTRSTAIVITVSGTTLTAGSENANTSNGGQYYSLCDIGGGKLVLYYRDGSAYYPNVMVLEVSGNTVTFGTTVVVNSQSYGGFCTPIYNPNYANKAILFGKIYTGNNYYSYASLAISGTTITVSNYSDGNIASDNCYVESFGKVADYSDYSGTYIAVYSDSDDSYKQCNRFCTTTDGATLTVGSENKDSAGSSLFYSGVVSNDVNDKSVVYFGDYANDDYEYYVVNPTYSNTVTTTTINLTTENFIGFSENAVSANETSKVKVVNIDDNQTGLTAGKIYYVKNDGTLSTTAESGKVVEAGKAISATKLLIRG